MSSAATKPKPTTLKLEPGTDLVGTVKFVSHFPEKEKDGETYGAQWGLTGTFNGTEAKVYIDLRKLSDAALAPFIKVDGKWDDGSPRYKWTETRPIRLHPYMRDKRHFVDVMVDGEKNGSPPVQRGDAYESQVGHPSGKGDVPIPLDDDEAEQKADAEAKAVRKRWADMADTYECCVKIAVKAWPTDLSVQDTALVAAAATLFIEANRRNLPPPPKRDAE